MTSPAKSVLPKKRVIIIDDDTDLLKLLIYAFEEAGFEAVGLSSGKEGIDFLREDKNRSNGCLLVLDRLLPDMDGIEILRQLPSLLKNPMPVLILSVLSTQKDILSGLKQGAVDYIAKPFNLPIFMEKATHLIDRNK